MARRKFAYTNLFLMVVLMVITAAMAAISFFQDYNLIPVLAVFWACLALWRFIGLYGYAAPSPAGGQGPLGAILRSFGQSRDQTLHAYDFRHDRTLITLGGGVLILIGWLALRGLWAGDIEALTPLENRIMDLLHQLDVERTHPALLYLADIRDSLILTFLYIAIGTVFFSCGGYKTIVPACVVLAVAALVSMVAGLVTAGMAVQAPPEDMTGFFGYGQQKLALYYQVYPQSHGAYSGLFSRILEIGYGGQAILVCLLGYIAVRLLIFWRLAGFSLSGIAVPWALAVIIAVGVYDLFCTANIMSVPAYLFAVALSALALGEAAVKTAQLAHTRAQLKQSLTKEQK